MFIRIIYSPQRPPHLSPRFTPIVLVPNEELERDSSQKTNDTRPHNPTAAGPLANDYPSSSHPYSTFAP